MCNKGTLFNGVNFARQTDQTDQTNQTNQTNQTDQTNQTNQTNQTDQTDQTDQMALQWSYANVSSGIPQKKGSVCPADKFSPGMFGGEGLDNQIC